MDKSYEYTEKSRIWKRYSELCNEIPKEIRKSSLSKVLDVGSYFGNLHYYLHKNLSCQIDGIDYKKNKNVDIVHNLWNIPYPIENNTYDIIIAGEILEHLTSPFETLLEFYRILKPKGRLILSTPNLQGSYYFLNRKYPWYYDGFGHVYAWNIALIRNLIKRSSFKFVKGKYTYDQIVFDKYVIVTLLQVCIRVIYKILPRTRPTLIVTAIK